MEFIGERLVGCFLHVQWPTRNTCSVLFDDLVIGIVFSIFWLTKKFTTSLKRIT